MQEPITDEPPFLDQPPEEMPAQPPVQEEAATPPSFPVNIAPTGQTQTACQIHPPSQYAFAAYHCTNLAKSALFSIANFHPFALLQTFVSSITQPGRFPNVMPLTLYITMQQPDHAKFVEAMEKELQQHAELKHFKIMHHSQVPKNAQPILMVQTLCHKWDLAGDIIKWKAQLCAGGCHQVYSDTYWTMFAPVSCGLLFVAYLYWPCCLAGTCALLTLSWCTHRPKSKQTFL